MKRRGMAMGAIFALAVVIGCGIYFSTDKTATEPFYKESLLGIPHLKGQVLVQDSMEEYGSGSTGGILSYTVIDTNMTVEKAADFFIKNTDDALWKVEKQEETEDSQVLIYDPVDKTNIKSTTQVILLKSDKGLVIDVVSFYGGTTPPSVS